MGKRGRPPKHPSEWTKATHNFRAEAAKNIMKPCKVEGCSQNRRGIARFCQPHTTLNKQYGSPLGRSIHPREYGIERELVFGFLKKNAEHPAVKAALLHFKRHLHGASMGDDVPARALMASLVEAGVTADQCLENTCALFMFHQRNPGAIPDNTALKHALAWAVLNTASRKKIGCYTRDFPSDPKPRRQFKYSYIGAKPRLELGESITRLMRFFVNVSVAISKAEQAATQSSFDLSKPFEEPPAPIFGTPEKETLS